MSLTSVRLRRELREAGIANSAVNAVWPQWWSREAESSVSAQAELVYTVALRLGLVPSSLLEGQTQFLWTDDTKFKALKAETDRDRDVLASFGAAAVRALLRVADVNGSHQVLVGMTASALRQTLLATSDVVGLQDIVAFCWSIGLPVVQLRVFPLSAKRMHAMTSSVSKRYAILFGSEYKYVARYAYVIAHEIGHIASGHLQSDRGLIDIDDPLTVTKTDTEEREADEFAMTLLTGEPHPHVSSDSDNYTATQLAHAAQKASLERQIDAGVLALCLGHSSGRWRQTFGALKIIPPGEQSIWPTLNNLASQQLALHSASFSEREYLVRLLGV